MSTPSSVKLLASVLLAFALPFGCGDCGGPTASDGGVDGGLDGDTPAVCGDGVVEGAETCDDGDAIGNDGCSSTCRLEPGWSCPAPGAACFRVSECGNAVIETGETCDDGDTDGNDGCSSTCQVENGWRCTVPGIACTAASCGDGIVAGNEECDDGDTDDQDGCDSACRLERGFKCPTPGAPCVATTCGDKIVEGTEQCDDGNNDLGDGCTPLCTREPECVNGNCTARCGDGIILPGDTSEACDDGNSRNGDGCSSTCTIEPGFECELVTEAPPQVMEIPVVYRDFRGWDLPGGHEDFQNKTGGLELGLVKDTLDDAGKPQFNKAGINLTTEANFRQWYRDVEGVNIPIVSTMILGLDGGAYVYDTAHFFPIDDAGWVALGQEPLRDDNDADSVADRNFNFTSEVRYWFEYKGTEDLQFRGDDDVWVFINRKLAVDIGGLHSARDAGITLNGAAASNLGLELGKIYETVVFQAERRTTASNYKLTLTNFLSSRSVCRSLCGNGTIDPPEECDEGPLNGADGGTCSPRCRLNCQAISESCSPTQGCCNGLVCINPTTQDVCDGTTACFCDAEFGIRPR